MKINEKLYTHTRLHTYMYVYILQERFIYYKLLSCVEFEKRKERERI